MGAFLPALTNGVLIDTKGLNQLKQSAVSPLNPAPF